MIKLSIIIPVYNQEELVARAIQSVPKRADVELVIVNDGSTDKTLDSIKKELEKYDTNRKLLDLKVNEGVANALNKALDIIEGEYFIGLGSDDYFYTDRLEKFIDTQLDGTDMVYFNLEINNGTLIEPKEETRNVWVGSTKAYRRLFVGDNRYPDNKRACEDLVFDCKVRQKEHTHKFSGMTIKHYNFPREGSLTWQVNHNEIDEEFIGK